MVRTLSMLAALALLTSGSAWADDCAEFKTDPKSEFASSERVDLIECRALTSTDRNGGKPLTLHQLVQARADLMNKQGATIWERVQAESLGKKIDCMATTANFSMCHCLSERLPMSVGFGDYVRMIAPSSRATAASLGLSEGDFAKLSGILWSVRDQCVVGR